MKIKDLQEIFEPAISTQTMDRYHSFDGLPKDPNAGERLGSGTFSSASEDKADPHMVSKQQHRKHSVSGLTDMFDEYAVIIARDKLWNMVHFPRVYTIKSYVDPQGETKSQWSMEKLIPMNSKSLNHLEINSLCERYFDEYVYEEISDAEFHLGEIAYQIEKIIEEDALHLIIDETFRAASKKLIAVYHELQGKYPSATMDLHDENIMYRRSPHGLDMVFSDPFVAT